MSLSIHSLDERRAISGSLESGLSRAASLILKEHNLQGEINIILADDRSLQQLNGRYRGKDTPTDVLSFGMIESDSLPGDLVPEGEALPVGDVYISLDRAEEQAREAGHSTQREILILAVHGMLHLVGCDHIRQDDYEAMRQKESEILAQAEQPEGGCGQ